MKCKLFLLNYIFQKVLKILLSSVLIILALLVSTTLAEEVTNEMDIDPANFNQMNMIHRMRYSMMGYNMAPPQEAIQHYNSINDEDFPIDYSLSCSNSCNCKTVCIMYWW